MMIPADLAVAFTAAPFPLASRSTFNGSKISPQTTSAVAVKRPHRARILALGAPPPPPKEPEEGAEPPEPVSEASTDPVVEGDAVEDGSEVTADDILNSPSFLKKKLEIVQKELIEAKKALEEDSEKVKEERARYVRLAADFENYRRRSMEDLRKQDSKSIAKVCKQILDVLDSFERASAAVNPETEKEKTISASYQSINKQLIESLVRLKVEPIESVGDVFDPEFHEAIQRMESTEHREDIVCAQFQRGYKIGDTLIRAAVVGVSSGPGPEGEEDEEGEVEALDVEATEDATDGKTAGQGQEATS